MIGPKSRPIAQWRGIQLALLAPALLFFSGCGHHKQTVQTEPPQAQAPQATEHYPSGPSTGRIPVTPVPPGGVSAEDRDYVATHRPILTEVGVAGWYTAYKGRKAANGQVFSDRAFTAAHRTLPMGSLIVVTNLSTGQSSAMRITDRGPFVDGRILDLTIASAKATGIFRVGIGRVRMDVYQAPKPILTGGRWCVQIGAFRGERDAIKLKEQLLRKYPTSSVIEFPGENSYWVRIRPEGDNREQAAFIAGRIRTAEGAAFLTRLD